MVIGIIFTIGHVNKYPIMQYFGIRINTQSMIAYVILTEYFEKIPVKNYIVGMLLTCPIEKPLELGSNRVHPAKFLFFKYTVFKSFRSGNFECCNLSFSVSLDCKQLEYQT